MKRTLSIMITIVLLITALSGCQSKPEELKPQTIQKIDFSQLGSRQTVAALQSDFAGELLRQALAENSHQNIMLSPMSIMFALSMTANGAGGNTLAEMESVLGHPVSELNPMLGAYMENLSSEKELKIANSLWIRDGSGVKDPFLSNCTSYYQAPVYGAPFDESTVKQINKWAEDHTDGMIKKLIDDL